MEIGVEGDDIEVVGNVIRGFKMADTAFGNLGLIAFEEKVDGGVGFRVWGVPERERERAEWCSSEARENE